LQCDDCLLITTADSTYCFIIEDPARHRGVLIGGVFGGSSVSSVLLGTQITKGGGRVSGLFARLCEGSRAIFFVASRDGVNKVVTSTITRLVHTRPRTAQLDCSPEVRAMSPSSSA
jgi:hypothetical protein